MTKTNPQKIHFRNSPRNSGSDFAYKSDQRNGLQIHPGGGVAAQARGPGPQPARTPPRARPGPARGPWAQPKPGAQIRGPNHSKSKLGHASRLEPSPQNQWTSKQIHQNPQKSLRSGRFQQVLVESYSTLPRGRRESAKNTPKTHKLSNSWKRLKKNNEKTIKMWHDMAWHSSCMTWHGMTWLNIYMYI